MDLTGTGVHTFDFAETELPRTRLGCVIVTHQSAGHIEKCLDALNRTGLFESGAVLVIDNASTDGTSEIVRRHGVKIIDSGNNIGFAAAANLGFQTLHTDFVLLLNPDVEVTTGIEHLVAVCERTGAAACGGQLTDAAGRPQRGFQVRRFPNSLTLAFECAGINRVFPGNSVNRRYRCFDFDPAEEREAEQPAGAFLLIRSSAWAAIGGFDEQFYPCWFEDVDFLLRLNRRGFRILYSPLAVGKHTGGHSVATLGWDPRQLYWYSNLLRFSAKHYFWGGRWLLAGAVVFGCMPRTITGIIRQRSLRPLVVYGRIASAAIMCLLLKKVPGETVSPPVAQPSEEAGY